MRKESSSCIISTFAWLGVLVIGAVFNGYVVSIIWDWFVVSKFELPALTVPEAISLVLVARTIVNQQRKSEPIKDWEDWLANSIAHSLMTPLAILAMAWIIKQFI